jgi:hypothetical protein
MLLFILLCFGLLFWKMLSFDTYVEALFWWSPRLMSKELVSFGGVEVYAATWVTIAVLAGMAFLIIWFGNGKGRV